MTLYFLGSVERMDRLRKRRHDLAEKVQRGEMKPTEAIRQMRKDEIPEKVVALPDDKAEAMREYARRARDWEFAWWAAELKLDAERKGGGLLKELGLSPGNPQWSQRATIGRLKDLGLTKSLSSRWQISHSVREG